MWFRQDLRLADNPALGAAVAEGADLALVYVLDTAEPPERGLGAASRWWLHNSLQALARNLAEIGGRLILRRGDPAQVIADLAAELDAGRVFFSRCYDPRGRALQQAVHEYGSATGIHVKRFVGSLLAEPEHIRTGAGGPYKVFTPFWRALQQQVESAPLLAPEGLPAAVAAASEDLASWQLQPSQPNWAAGFSGLWQPGEAGAGDALEQFLVDAAADYAAARDRPDQEGTSRLSPHLHFGELSPRTVWQRARHVAGKRPGSGGGVESFLRELGWREFCYHLLNHWPELTSAPLRPEFRRFPWREDAAALAAWQRGLTGVPLVDAGMRQLWESGWMHNRVRMVVASFLVKNLLLPWQAGEAWFRDTLVDADLANNAAGWQWVAGCGTDAAPFFRIFNPVRQGEKFDPQGHYVKRWVPELRALPAKFVHQPWALPAPIAEELGFQNGRDYPHPLVDLSQSRKRALAAYQGMRDESPAATSSATSARSP
jgi:deoxyribodipyrimidine photo-lyase